jgi:hypothetical protein
MKMPRLVAQWKRIVISALCLILSSCGSLFPDASTSPLSSTSQLTHDGTQASFDCGGEMLSIGSSGYSYMEFIDIFGKKRSELTSGLYIYISNKPGTNRSFRAYTGLTIYYYIYKIQVLRLGRDLQNPFTEVDVKFSEEQQSTVHFTYCSSY